MDFYYADAPEKVEVTDDEVRVTLADGRTIITPLSWYPTLQAATPEQRNHVDLQLSGILWPDLDDYGLSVEGMLKGQKPRI